MNRQTAPAVPNALPLTEALRRSAPLADLRRRLRESLLCLETIRPALPPGLRAHVQAGPVDSEGWTLLAGNAAVAAKLKQLKPRLEEALVEAGCPARLIRIKVIQRDPGPGR
jgi:hypothetical protein